MLQRAASNAYSWWWASHIRTKQSKWLEQNLQDMEEKVAYALKLIEEDGDSFAKRAEMYYKRRPEIIGLVEEAFRAYRALATRYDHLSTELQNANTTIAAFCPDQVHFAMDDDEEDATKSIQKKRSENSTKNIPKVPNMPKKDLQGIFTSPTKKLQPSKSTKKPTISKIVKPKSGLSKPEGLKEIDKLQKQILVLQTEKEFVKSSYESWLAKYWEIEDQINEVQQKVCSLQDEFGEGMIIEDDDARNLMTTTALKSCQETLDRLQEKQEKSGEEEKVETKRVGDTPEKFESVKNEANEKMASAKDDSVKAIEEVEKSEQGAVSATQEIEDLESLREKIKEQFEDDSTVSLTVTEMADKIDEVVDKVVNLEVAFSSQTSLVQRLRAETNELQEQIRTLEEDKVTLINEKNDLSSKLMGTEKKLCRLQNVNQSIEDQNTGLKAHYTEANCNLDHLSDMVQCVVPDKELEHSSQMKEKSPVHANSHKEIERQGAPLNLNDDLKVPQSVKLPEDLKVRTPSEKDKKSPAKVQFVEGIGGVEGGTNLVDEKLPTEKPDEEHKLSCLKQNEEKSMAKALSVEEFKEKEEKQNLDDVPEKARDVQTELVNDIKEHAISPTPGNQGEAVKQYQTRNDADKLSENSQEQMNDEEIDKQALSVESDNLLNVKRQEQVAEQEKSQDQTSNEPGKLSEKSQDQMKEGEIDKRALSVEPDNLLNVKRKEQVTEQEYEPDWKQMFLNGMENREKTLLAEYTTVLRNCKELKKKLNEADMKTGNCNNETTMELQELRSANTVKDEEIRSLRQKLSLLQAAFGDNNDLDDQYAEHKVTVTETSETRPTDREVDIKVIREDQAESDSGIEEKFRMGIDELLEENLDFWLRFSTSFHQIQKFETEVKDLQAEATKLEERQKKQEGSSSMKYSLQSDGRPLYKHLTEIQTELAVWLEKSASLQEELKSRCSSLCGIQEEITKALKLSAEDDDFKFTSYQAAKFQGEILNMKQENNKVAGELQAGLDHVTNLKLEIEKTLNLLGEKFGLSETKSDPNKLEHSDSSRSQVPLRSFIFGVKPKKQRSSFFSNMHPALARKYNGFMSGASR